MSHEQPTPTKSQVLAAMLTGGAKSSSIGGSVQRSHRFPLHLFTQIENMSRISGASVSMIVNELIECGIDTVMQTLPEDVRKQVTAIAPEQLDRKITQLSEPAEKPKKARAK